MISKPLALLLMLVLSLQSLIAAADMHQLHQPAGGHQLNAAADMAAIDSDPTVSSKSAKTSDSTVLADACQHCCHCHGGGLLFIPGRAPHVYFSGITLTGVYPVADAEIILSAPALRPPIV